MSDHDNPDDETRRDFLAWCERDRLLGRDRLWPAFRAGWAYGHATGVDQVLEQHHHMEDSDK